MVAAVVEAVAVSTVAEQRARVVLIHYGIDPDAAVDAFLGVLEARGWRVTLEQVFGRSRGKAPRWSGHATLVAPPGSSTFRRPEHITLTGGRGQEVLTRIMAKVLDKEEREREW